ncbi:peroxiredoxin family protein [Thalassoroseus pseudoceratinae]|uniref:peroxiredoxin family protein n=1 Tax=Thalassoroseus pseudoceratinae TaxID=2713176 RepID=UPI00141FF3A9|nr:redoxin domain-containing protein [Thalassoroseus pseudoceratinae]
MSPSCLVCTLLAILPAASVTEVQYVGQLKQVAGEGVGDLKSFELTCRLLNPAGKSQMFWSVEETGGGEFAWPERFGIATFQGANQLASGQLPRVLQTHNDSPSPVDLPPIMLPTEKPLEVGQEWEHQKTQYVVEGEQTVRVSDGGDKVDCWVIEMTSHPGRQTKLVVEKENLTLLTAEGRLFLGRGDRYQIQMERKSSRSVEGPLADQLATAFDGLTNLQTKLERRTNETTPKLHDNQLKLTAKALPELEKSVRETSLQGLVAAIKKDVEDQTNRDRGLNSLAEKFLGESAPDFALSTLQGKSVSLKGDTEDDQIVVLHFWKYHDEKLNEPYGQVGYLDFLHGKRNKLGVQIYGVAVDERFGTGSDFAAKRGVRKLAEFMNLGYPILLDDGDVLKTFGDPLNNGGELPLWVVIKPDKTVAHYKVGFYQIKPNRGLEELDAVVVDLIKKRREAAE